MKRGLIVAFFVAAGLGCLGQLMQNPKPRVMLAWQDKVFRCAVLVKDTGIDAIVDAPTPLPYSPNAAGSIWVGTQFPAEQVAEIIDIGRTYYPELRYVALSDHSMESPPDQVHHELYLGGSTETALKLGLKAWTDADFQKLKTFKTAADLHAFIRSKYGQRRSQL